MIRRPPRSPLFPSRRSSDLLSRLFHDRLEPLLLLVRRVYLDVQVLECPIEMLIDGRGVEQPRGVAAAVPAAAAALSEGLEADSRGDSTDQRGDRRALEEFPALAGIALLRFHGFVLS